MMQSNRNKTLAILGSPRTDGITAQMLDIAIDAVKARGDEVIYMNLYEKNIQFCRGCRKCLGKKECVMIKDDMAEITEWIKESNTIILGCAGLLGECAGSSEKFCLTDFWGPAMEETATFPKAPAVRERIRAAYSM